ncbi:MAG: hypothetical protein ACYDBV_00365 [Nitrospiria bacterium]
MINLIVDCFPSTTGSKEDKEVTSFEGFVQNIGNGGVNIVTSYPLNINEVLKIAFPIQSSISTFISTPRTLAEVRWVKPVSQDKFFAGLHFLL